MKNCILIGVAGGSGSGKTTVANNLVKAFKAEDATLLEQDAYYRELTNMTLEEKAKVNFDHPDSIEFELLRKHIVDLKNGKSIERPIYDFTTHSRKEGSVKINPSKIIVVEGILIFAVPEIRELFDVKIFVDTDADEMILRRIERDMNERGRSFESVKNQYLTTVKPMYLEFCEPSKRYADVIIPRGGKNKIAIDMLVSNLKRYIEEK
ncbi:uridine kinase [Fusobacterium perfoetens]|uniref:uridine kinase n=1 Tax=Fusobacterium perfoetens TaxID=852 RepID=UPI001F33069A|nr:uridine kinase [Fusobacterium perfoetens]MCF2613275.1 uridine kinase [Fusobacterium perfoetens]